MLSNKEDISIDKKLWSALDRIRGSRAIHLLDVISLVYCAYLTKSTNPKEDPVFALEACPDAEVRTYLREFLYAEPELVDEIMSLVDSCNLDELKSFLISPFSSDTFGRHFTGFGTPSAICDLAIAILDISDNEIVGDLCCGYGNFLVSAAKRFSGSIFCGTDIMAQMVIATIIRLSLLNVNYSIAEGDALNGCLVQKCDKLFANYPFGIKPATLKSSNSYYESIRIGKTSFGRPLSTDWIFNLLAYDSLKEGGKAVTVTANGATFNGRDRQARKYFLDNNMIEAAIAMPPRLIEGTGISITIFVLGEGSDAIRMVDASDLYIPGRSTNTLDTACVDAIIQRLNTDSERSRLVGKDEITALDYCLYPARYFKRDIEMENPTPLGELTSYIDRGPTSLNRKMLDELASEEDTHFSYIQTSNIEDGGIGGELIHLAITDNALSRYYLQNGDLIITRNGAPFKVAVVEVPEGETYIANSNSYILRFDIETFNPYYLAAFLNSPDGIESLERIAAGTAIPNISLSNLRNLVVPVPSLEEQELIGQEFRATRDAVEVLKIKLEKARCDLSEVYSGQDLRK